MLKNGILAAVVQLLLSGLAYWALGWNQNGALATAFPERVMVQNLIALLIPWLAGIVCLLVGYRMQSAASFGKSFLSTAWLVLLATVISGISAILTFGTGLSGAFVGTLFLRGLALPFVPLLMILGCSANFVACIPLAFFGPLLMLAGIQIRQGKQGKRSFALGFVIFYLLLLLLLPVAGLMLQFI